MTRTEEQKQELEFSRQAEPATRTYDEHATPRLVALVDALGLPQEAKRSVPQAWRAAVGELADRVVPDAPPWSCSISDDSTPIEFSLVLDAKAPELRLLWEPQGNGADPRARHRVAQATLGRLEQLDGVSLLRLRQLEALFLPETAELDFLAWHAVRLWPAGPSEFKIYLNPSVALADNALDLLEDAMGRLGLQASWPSMLRGIVRPGVDEIRYISLDLRQGLGARLKVYVYHPDATGDIIAATAAACPRADGQRLRSFFETVTAGRRPVAGFCPGSCLSFVKEQGPEPAAVTLHVPVRGYVRSDQEVTQRVEALTRAPGEGAGRSFLSSEDLWLHGRAVAALATRPLQEGVGLTSYLSLRSQGTAERVTAYLATELFATEPARSD